MSMNYRRAFSLVEVIIAVAVIAIVGIVISLNLFGGKNQADLNSPASQIVASLRQTQSQAMAQSGNSVWGIHFANTTNTPPYYAVFKGASYATGTIQSRYPLPPTVAYVTSTLPVGSSMDITFSGITGASSASTTIGLYLISNPSDQQNIVISGLGVVSYGSSSGSGSSSSCSGHSGTWMTTASLPGAIEDQASVVNNGYIYSMGGQGPTSTVSYSQINNSNGSLGAWQPTTALPTALQEQSAVVNNGYVYSIGGTDGSSIFSSVYYSQINNSNGSLGAWQPTTALPVPLIFDSAVVNNGYVYTIGGVYSGHLTSTVYYSQINNSNGTLNSWQPTTALPTFVEQESAVANNGYAYSIGGTQSSGISSTVYYASLCN